MRGFSIALHEYETSEHVLANISTHFFHPETMRVADISFWATQAILTYRNASFAVAPTSSDGSIATAEVLLRHGIPVIGAASADVLSNKGLYPNFFRITASQKLSVRAALGLLVRQGWTQGVSVVAGADSFGLAGQDTIAELAPEFGVSVAEVQTIPENASPTVMLSVVSALRSSGARVFVAFALPPVLGQLIQAAKDHVNIVGEGYAWIFPSAIDTFFSPAQRSMMEGAVLIPTGPKNMSRTTAFTGFVEQYQAAPEGIYPDWIERVPAFPQEAQAWHGYTMGRTVVAALNATIAAGHDPANHTAVLSAMRTVRVDLQDGEVFFYSANQEINAQASFEQFGPGGEVTLIGHTEGENNDFVLADASSGQIYLAGGLSEFPSQYVPETCFGGSDSYYRDGDTGQCHPCAKGEWNAPSDGVDECVPHPGFESDDPLSREEVAYLVSGILGAILVTGLVSYMLYLRHARDVADRHAQQSSDYTAFIFHEARNPLSAIASYLEFIWHGVQEHEALGHSCSCDQCTASAKQLRSDLDKAQASLDHTIDVLNNVLDLSKLAASKLVLDESRADIQRICQAAVDMMSGTNSTVEVELNVVVHADVRAQLSAHGLSELLVGVDARRMRQVLVNLLSNALKFTSEGFVELRVDIDPRLETAAENGDSTKRGAFALKKSRSDVRVAASDGVRLSSLQPQQDVEMHAVGDGPWQNVPVLLRISVTDTGCGIPAEQQSKIFNVYESSKSHHGTGLGLVLSQKFVQLMGGEITFESPWSPEYSGTRFEFTIPSYLFVGAGVGAYHVVDHRVRILDGIPPAAAAAGHSSALEISRSSVCEDEEADELSLPLEWRILVVDDVPLNVKVMKRKLEVGPFAKYKGHWTVESATNGEEALALIEARGEEAHFHLIILDQIMFSSGGTLLGTQVAERIRNFESHLRLGRSIIIISSGNVAESDLEGYREADADLCWGKPLPDVQQMHWDLLQLFLFEDE